MPCRDDYASIDRDRYYDQMSEVREQNNQLTKFLCTVLTTLEEENELGHFAELFNYKEGGFARKELFDWWTKHKEEDRKRREHERAEQERQAKKEAALSKLTPEERKLLGVK